MLLPDNVSRLEWKDSQDNEGGDDESVYTAKCCLSMIA